jgi:hypothetical protein
VEDRTSCIGQNKLYGRQGNYLVEGMEDKPSSIGGKVTNYLVEGVEDKTSCIKGKVTT